MKIYVWQKNEKGLAIVVYAYDNLTNDLCGFKVQDWQRKCMQVMSRFTFSSLLPIDLIKVSKLQNGVRNLNLQIDGARYLKTMNEGHADSTCLTDSNGRFCFSSGDVDLEGCGLVNHPNIRFVLPLKSYTRSATVPASAVLSDEIEVKVIGEAEDGQFVNRFLSAEQVEEIPLFFKKRYDLAQH
jgi:hypothetical protein